ncbi:MAG: hypothetical protein ACRBCJ_03005 [Hyphomicrobiaceae bacterium]
MNDHNDVSVKIVPPDKTHWLVQATTIRKLWIGSCVGLAVLVLLDLVVEHHPHFGIDGTFGFGAWFGFVSCVILVVGAKALGVLLKRPDDYYDR